MLQSSNDSLRPAETGLICTALWCILVLYMVFRAAAVTEKCSRVPALVNSWMMEERPFDEGRQYVVQYITNGAAGFYVKGVRLTAFMATKLAYFFGIIMFTVVSQSILAT